MRILLALVALTLITGCQPRVKIESPDKPIEINLNVNIEHRIKVQIDKDLDSLINKNSALF